MPDKKKVPNPYGKKGGKKHQNRIDEIEKGIDNKGLIPDKEHAVEIKNGKKRYVDIAGLNQDGDIEELHQVGKQNKNGTPVSRERKAIKDIEKATGKKVFFHPYNIILILIFIGIIYAIIN